MSKESCKTQFAAERAMLHPLWTEFDSEKTDQNNGFPVPEKEKEYPGERIALKPFSELEFGMSLKDAFTARKSARKYTDGYMSRDELSFLLYSTMGVHTVGEKFVKRTVPSAGARHCLEMYVYIQRAEGIEPGLYYYSGIRHDLTFVKAVTPEEMNAAMKGQLFNSAVILIWSAIPYKMEWRYTTVAHKMIAIDAGHSCEHTYLAALAVGCGCCAIGAYDQKASDALLGIDGDDEFTIYMATIGKL